MTHIHSKATAALITSFVQTAKNGTYARNRYHEALFDYYVRKIGIIKPFRPPYYSEEFFNLIKDAETEGMNVVEMNMKDWYWRLTERRKTHYYNADLDLWELTPSYKEFIFPQIDHSNVYRCIRYSGLPAQKMSTLFKLRNSLFLTEERRMYCKLSSSNRCVNCSRMDHDGHFFICCGSKIREINEKLIYILQRDNVATSLEQIANVDLRGEKDSI